MLNNIEQLHFLDEQKQNRLKIITKAREQSNISNSLKGILTHIKPAPFNVSWIWKAAAQQSSKQLSSHAAFRN